MQQKKFNDLNLILDSAQSASIINPVAEDSLFTAYASFDIEDLSYEMLFNAWVEETPDSYQSYLARAVYYYRLGWDSRGAKWTSETKEEQINEMEQYFGKALNDIAVALKINHQSMLAYFMLIGITNAQGRDDESAMVVRKALNINPASYKVRSYYLKFLAPRWGGTVEQMKAFIDESLIHVQKNPKLSLLEGFLYSEVGDMQSTVKKYSTADKLYTKALTYGDNHEVFWKRAKSSYRQKNDRAALEDINRAIELYSDNADYYYWRSKIYGVLKKYQKASSDIERAAKLKPNKKSIQKQRKWIISKLTNQGYELGKSRKSESAIEKYTAALHLDPNNAYLHYRRGRALVDKYKYESARSDLEMAIKLDPNNYDYYALLDWVLAKRKDWNLIIKYWDQYILLNPDNGRAYVERGGAYYHKGDTASAVRDAKVAADMGNPEGKEAYEKFRHMVQ